MTPVTLSEAKILKGEKTMLEEKDLSMDKIADQLMEWVNEEEPESADEEVLKLAEEKTAYFREFVKAHEDNYENSIMGLLTEDDYLLEELTDKLAMANLIELDEETDLYVTERTYLSLIDTCFETAKILNPMDGLGRDRLEAGLGILDGFEKEYWPLLTGITAENAEAFYDLIPDEHYDDILEGRKNAIGAVRLENGKATTAGVAVYSIQEDTATYLKLDWIYVAEDLRQHGVGNMLMAKLLETAFTFENCTPVLDINMPGITEDEDKDKDKEAFAVLANFLDSWKFDFDVDTGTNFFFRVSDKENNAFLKGTTSGVKSLTEMGADAEKLVKSFINKLDSDYDETIKETSFSFFDPDVSCGIVEDGELTAILLLHKYKNNDYRYEALRFSQGYDTEAFKKLVRYAYCAMLRKADTESIVFGEFESMEGFEMVKEVFPAVRTMLLFHGELRAPMPEEVITSEQWDELRQKAGFSDDKLPEGDISEEDFSKENMDKLAAFLNK